MNSLRSVGKSISRSTENAIYGSPAARAEAAENKSQSEADVIYWNNKNAANDVARENEIKKRNELRKNRGAFIPGALSSEDQTQMRIVGTRDSGYMPRTRARTRSRTRSRTRARTRARTRTRTRSGGR